MRTCAAGNNYRGTEAERRRDVGSNTGLLTGRAWTKAMKGGWPKTDTEELVRYSGLQRCGKVGVSGRHMIKPKTCWWS